MVKAFEFYRSLNHEKIDFITGVPDSLLAELCACFEYECLPNQHIVAANEGNAIAMAVGHFLATNFPALVYMQNSGLGNALNPLVSLTSREVYSIPMLLVIGWRGEIDENGIQIEDEPQHMLQGKITTQLLDLLEIPFQILDKKSNIKDILRQVVAQTISEQRPVALLVRKDTFEKYTNKIIKHKSKKLTRKKALEQIVSFFNPSIPVIATTGKLSRELYEFRNIDRNIIQHDFLTVGGMGHASSIATGFANSFKGKVLCLDGDGALLMHMGALTTSAKISNLIHFVFNNGAHESVGGQPTMGLELSLKDIAFKCGYQEIFEVDTSSSIRNVLSNVLNINKSIFVEVLCSNYSESNISRPSQSARTNRDNFVSSFYGELN